MKSSCSKLEKLRLIEDHMPFPFVVGSHPNFNEVLVERNPFQGTACIEKAPFCNFTTSYVYYPESFFLDFYGELQPIRIGWGLYLIIRENAVAWSTERVKAWE